MKTTLLIIACLLTSLAKGQTTAVHVVEPGLRIVDPSDWPYITWETATTSINDAVHSAISEGLSNVWVSNGTYFLTNTVAVVIPLIIRSWNSGGIDRDNTIIDCSLIASGYSFNINNSNAVLAGVTIRNANDWAVLLGAVSGSQGGAISNCIVINNNGGITARDNSMVLDTHILNNERGSGGWPGGLFLINAVASNCLISGNTATYDTGGSYRGGGGVSVNGVAGLLTDCVISNNTTPGVAGGVAIAYGGTVRNCSIVENTCGYAWGGGGVFIYRGIVKNSIIAENTNTHADGWGGGVTVWNEQEGPALRNCLVMNNKAARYGGGVHINPSATTLTTLENCTITANIADPGTNSSSVGGLYIGAGITTLRNCIIYGNTNHGSTRSNIIWTTSGTRLVENTCVAPLPTHASFTVTNSFADNPQLDAGYRPQPGSPCINAGLYQSWMDNALDLDGRTRIDRFSGMVDIGCYEYISRGTLYLVR